MSAAAARLAAGACLIALSALCVAWELWLAPLRPGGSWLAMKALPALAALPGVLRGRVYTFQWSLLLIPAYGAEGVVRAWSETGTTAQLAWAEIVLAAAFYASAIAYVRQSRRAR